VNHTNRLPDNGVYLEKDLDMKQNWKPFHGDSWEIARGIVMHKSPGHTPGLCIMQLNLENSGTWIFTTDQYHVKENVGGVPQGWLARDHSQWVKSDQMILQMQRTTGAKLVLGHCKETLAKYKLAPEFYE
jgi:glyoxylase-like metal-dependent hydrolase (beta-lactamase superfamily II)